MNTVSRHETVPIQALEESKKIKKAVEIKQQLLKYLDRELAHQFLLVLDQMHRVYGVEAFVLCQTVGLTATEILQKYIQSGQSVSLLYQHLRAQQTINKA